MCGSMSVTFLTETPQPPTLEDEPGAQWSEEMKDFIKQS
jgi:hypothetical protein